MGSILQNSPPEYENTDTILDSGGYSIVKIAIQTKTQTKVAVKCVENKKDMINNNDISLDMLRNESDVLAKINQSSHPNIITMHCFIDNGTSFYIYMDLIEGGSMYDWVIKDYPIPVLYKSS